MGKRGEKELKEMSNLDVAEASVPERTQHQSWRGLQASFPVMLGFIPFALVLGSQAAQEDSLRSKCLL